MFKTHLKNSNEEKTYEVKRWLVKEVRRVLKVKNCVAKKLRKHSKEESKSTLSNITSMAILRRSSLADSLMGSRNIRPIKLVHWKIGPITDPMEIGPM